MARFSIGQEVELLRTIPSPEGGTLPAGSVAIVREVDLAPLHPLYRVVFVEEGHPVGEVLWLGANDIERV